MHHRGLYLGEEPSGAGRLDRILREMRTQPTPLGQHDTDQRNPRHQGRSMTEETTQPRCVWCNDPLFVGASDTIRCTLCGNYYHSHHGPKKIRGNVVAPPNVGPTADTCFKLLRNGSSPSNYGAESSPQAVEYRRLQKNASMGLSARNGSSD